MISLTFQMICESILASLVAGLICGLIYALASGVLSMIKACFGKNKVERSLSGFNTGFSILEFLYFLFIGVILLLLNYAFCDGIFTLYTVISFALAFFCVRKTLGSILNIQHSR